VSGNRTVAWTGTGTGDDPRRPDLPEGVGFSVVEDHGDGTCTVEFDDPQATERELAELRETVDALTMALLEVLA
jgi:hypothetical protein